MQQLLDEKDAEIRRLQALLAAHSSASSSSSCSPSPPSPAAPTPPTPTKDRSESHSWVKIKSTRLRRSSTTSTTKTEVEQLDSISTELTQPYDVVLQGGGPLGCQLSRVYVAVRRDGTTGGSLSKLFALSGAGANAHLATPFILQERVIVVKVEQGGAAEQAGVLVGSTLCALNNIPMHSVGYTSILQQIRAASSKKRNLSLFCLIFRFFFLLFTYL